MARSGVLAITAMAVIAAAADVIADARTEPNPEIFHPGDGRSFYGGVSWTW